MSTSTPGTPLHRIVTGAAAAIALLLALTGCLATASPTSDQPRGSNAENTSSADAGDSDDSRDTNEPADSEAPDEDDGTAAFGESYAWEDGLAVTIGKPETFKPSEYAYGHDNKYAVKFTVRIVNKTEKPFDASLFSATVQSGSTEGSQIFDSEKKIDGAPSTKVLPGREVTFVIAFSIDNKSDIVMEVNPDFDHESVLYQS